MKLHHKTYGILAVALTFASCDSYVMPDTPDTTEGKLITITGVSQSGFTSDADTRTAYTDAYATSFEEGDRLGLVLVGDNGEQIANVPFSYTAEATWSNDRNQLYLADVAKAIAYYPYDDQLPTDICDAAALKNNIDIATDQSDRNAFMAADLLVCELEHPGADINIRFSHAFSMLRFSARASVKAGGRNYEYGISLEGLKVNIGNEAYTPCYMNEGYVMIVKDATELQPELFKYTYRRFGEERSTKTITAARSTEAGTVFSFPCPSDGTGDNGLTAGDYYCATEGNGMVVIPAGAAEIPAGLICKGIVFHVMDNEAFTGFADTNGLAAAEYPGVGGRHGLIVSLVQGGLILSGYNAGDAGHNAFLTEVFADVAGSGDTNIPQGYRLTQILATAYNNSNGGVAFTGLDGADGQLPDCTGWYLPSFHELKYLVRGEDNLSAVSLAGQEMLNRQLNVVSGTLLEGNMPSVSYKPGEGFCIMQNGEEMGWHGVPDGEKCRPICAF